MISLSNYFVNKNDNIIFSRKIQISDWWIWKLTLNVTWENITNIDYSKIYVCKTEWLTADEVTYWSDCIPYSEIVNNDTLDYYDNLYIYALNWAVNSDYKKININFKLKILSWYISY